MPKLFSCFSWNVEHFGGNASTDSVEFKQKVEHITSVIKNEDPDIFAIYEVRGEEVFFEFMNIFTGYQFFITEGPETQEILVGIRSGFTAFVTQRLEFNAGNPYLRPGLFLTVFVENKNYTLLFLHLKSTNTPHGWGTRDFMIDKVRSLKKALNNKAENPDEVRYIVMGDLNTMGMNYTYGDKDITQNEEIDRIEDLLSPASYNMRRLVKSHDYTFYNGSGSSTPPSDLDHVFATQNINFKIFNSHEVNVKGLTNHPLNSQAQDDWIAQHSDHAYLYFEVLD